MVPNAPASAVPPAGRATPPDPSLSRAIAAELRRLGQLQAAAPDALHELLAILFIDGPEVPAAAINLRLAAALMQGDAEAAWAAARQGRRRGAH